MNGYRDEAWLLAMNPVFGWNLSKGYRNGAPDFSLQFKATRKASETVALGAEYYSSSGQRRTSFLRQSKATRSSPSPISNSRAGA
jgi:hypothetical protein